MNALARLAPHYNTTRPAPDTLWVAIATGTDFPYRINPAPNGGGFRLSQAYSGHMSVKASFYKIKDFDTEEQALEMIIKRHNRDAMKTSSYLTIIA